MMLVEFIKKHLNIISLILLVSGLFSVGLAGAYGGILIILLFVLIVCISIADIIANSDSSVSNFLSLVAIVYLFESVFLKKEMLPYTFWFVLVLFALLLFNLLRKNKILKYSTLIVLCYTIVFHLAIYRLSYDGFTKNIFRKVGYQGERCILGPNCVKYKIPQRYDELKFISTRSQCPVFRGIKKDKVIFINHLNLDIFPNAQGAEFLGTGETNGNLFFKVKENDKFGIYVYDSMMCLKYEFSGEKKVPENLNKQALRELVPPVYDNIQSVKTGEDIPASYNGDNYEAPSNYQRIFAFIAKKGDLYDLYTETSKSQHYVVMLHDNVEFQKQFKDKKSIEFIKPKEFTGQIEKFEKFKIDGKDVTIRINK